MVKLEFGILWYTGMNITIGFLKSLVIIRYEPNFITGFNKGLTKIMKND